ncbi:MAG: aconitate hydratase AcnA [Pseudomonadota bacterium]
MQLGPEFTRTFSFGGEDYTFVDIAALERAHPCAPVAALPFCLRVLLESNLRRAADDGAAHAVLRQFSAWQDTAARAENVAIHPTRVLLQDYTGIPVLVDLCSLRQAAVDQGLDPDTVNPRIPVDLIVDHSIVVDASGSADAEQRNSADQHVQNRERFAFLKWTAQAFRKLRVIPPDSGICHQVNLESLATGCVLDTQGGQRLLYPELVIGADSHTPTINALGVLGWGVGGIEALSASLGEPLQMPLPEVVGVHLTGRMAPGVTATDCVLTVTQMLRSFGVVEKFVEFFGPGVATLAVPDRATIANMAPEYGATCAFFPWDAQTLQYFETTGREGGERLRAFAENAHLWQGADAIAPAYSHVIEFDLGAVEPVIAGPKRPEERRTLREVPDSFARLQPAAAPGAVAGAEAAGGIPTGAVLLAAITSCTNTANPSLVIAAGLVAKKAVEAGLQVPAWVKTSFTPGSLVVSQYLRDSGLQAYLDQLGFQICGFGCTTCIGNSGPLLPDVAEAVEQTGLVGCAVVSGNRNFSGRVQQQLAFNYLASPPLVVAYALAGTVTRDLGSQPLGHARGRDVYLADLWPTAQEIQKVFVRYLDRELFQLRRGTLSAGGPAWDRLQPPASQVYDWADQAGYIARPPFFSAGTASDAPAPAIAHARVLLLLGDGVTTDDISPAGRIRPHTAAGRYLAGLGVPPERMHTFGARRGHWDVMLRGAFSNPNLVNELLPDTHDGSTRLMPEGTPTSVLDAAATYRARGEQVVVVAGRNYGTGSSRDDAARSTRLLGVAAVIAESFERIHRANLASFGVMPLLFTAGQSRKTLGLDGSETFSIPLGALPPLAGDPVACTLTRADGRSEAITLASALRGDERGYFTRGGILPWLADKACAGTAAA